jgi:hypothetical protein
MDSCLKDIGGQWINAPAAIFYTEKAHPEGSNYMAIYYSDNYECWMVTNGLSAVEGDFNGILLEDGTLVHSRFRHDYFEHGGAVADGGRDYFRSGGVPSGSRVVKFRVEEGRLVESVQ